MINHKGSFYLGVFVFVIPFLGFPTIWKMGFVLFSGILLIVTSIKVPMPKKLQRNNYQKKDKPEAPIEIPNTKPVESVPIVTIVHEPISTPASEDPQIKHPIIVKKVSSRTSSKGDIIRKPKAREQLPKSSSGRMTIQENE